MGAGAAGVAAGESLAGGALPEDKFGWAMGASGGSGDGEGERGGAGWAGVVGRDCKKEISIYLEYRYHADVDLRARRRRGQEDERALRAQARFGTIQGISFGSQDGKTTWKRVNRLLNVRCAEPSLLISFKLMRARVLISVNRSR